MGEQAAHDAQTPDDDLASKIADAIGAANLVSADKLDRIRQGLCKGSLSSADWKLLVELGSHQEGTEPQ